MRNIQNINIRYGSGVPVPCDPKDISKNKVVKTKSESLSDEELAARLSQFPSWDEVDHADLSSINYSNYKPFESPKTKEVISKWL